MKLTKEQLLSIGQLNLNCYKDEKWFGKHKCIYDPNILDNYEQFKIGQEEGHFGSYNDVAYIIIRGSSSWADWKSNFDFELITEKIKTNAKVHKGFRSGWKQIKPYVYDKIAPFKKVVISGHSRGAAVATIGAENISFDFMSKDITLVALSSPMAGNAEFVRLVDGRIPDIYRIWLGTDPIVKTPPWCFGYRHVHGGIWLHGNNLLPWYWPGLAISAIGDITGLPLGYPGVHYPDKVLQAIKDAKDI
jgi:hypothetical protein